MDEPTRDRLVDAALAGGCLAISASILAGIPSWSAPPLAWGLAAAHNLPVALRRRAPRAAFAVGAAAAAAYLALDWPMVGLGLGALVLTHGLAAGTPRRQSLAGLAVAVAVLAAAGVLNGHPQPDTLAGNVLILAAAWTLGDGARRRRLAAAAERERAAHQAVTEERLRIARELHDVVAHSMSVIAVQAGAGRMVIGDDPDHARRALASIEETSRLALDEMRRLLGVLRAGEGPDGADLAPVPDLSDLDRLATQAAEGGTPVEVEVSGDRRRLAAGVELTAYRVVQEALTNSRRHAPGASARVAVSYGDEALVVEVENSVPAGVVPGGGGHGLLGMRERVSLHGGTLDAGPTASGTFRVRASIPYDGSRQ